MASIVLIITTFIALPLLKVEGTANYICGFGAVFAIVSLWSLHEFLRNIDFCFRTEDDQLDFGADARVSRFGIFQRHHDHYLPLPVNNSDDLEASVDQQGTVNPMMNITNRSTEYGTW